MFDGWLSLPDFQSFEFSSSLDRKQHTPRNDSAAEMVFWFFHIFEGELGTRNNTQNG